MPRAEARAAGFALSAARSGRATGVNGTADYDRTNTETAGKPLGFALWSNHLLGLLEKVDQPRSNQQDVVRNERRRAPRTSRGLPKKRWCSRFPEKPSHFGNVIGSTRTSGGETDDVRDSSASSTPNNASVSTGDTTWRDQAPARATSDAGSVLRPAIKPRRRDHRGTPTGRSRARVQLPRVSIAVDAFDLSFETPTPISWHHLAADARAVCSRNSSTNSRSPIFGESVFAHSRLDVPSTRLRARPNAEESGRRRLELATFRTQGPRPPKRTGAQHDRNGHHRWPERLGVCGAADRLNIQPLSRRRLSREDILRCRASRRGGVRETIHQRPCRGACRSRPACCARAGLRRVRVAAARRGRTDNDERGATSAQGGPRPLRQALRPPRRPRCPPGYATNERRAADRLSQPGHQDGSDSNPTDKSLATRRGDARRGHVTRNALQLADETARRDVDHRSSMDATSITARSLSKNPPRRSIWRGVVAAAPRREIERQRARLAQPCSSAIIRARSQRRSRRRPTDASSHGYTELGTEASVVGQATLADPRAPSQQRGAVVAGTFRWRSWGARGEGFAAWQRGAPVGRRCGPRDHQRAVRLSTSPVAADRASGRSGPARSTPDFLPLQVMNNELGGLFSSRINMNLREHKGYTYSARSGFAFRRNGGPFTIGAGVRTDATAPAVSEIFKEVEGIIAMPVTAEQLRKAKDALANSIPAAFETSQNSVNSFSNIFVYDLGLDYYTRYAQRVNAVTAAQALEVAKKYVLPGRLVVIAVGDRAAIEADLRKLNLGPMEVRDAEGRPAS